MADNRAEAERENLKRKREYKVKFRGFSCDNRPSAVGSSSKNTYNIKKHVKTIIKEVIM